jgi:hypothetical protein
LVADRSGGDPPAARLKTSGDFDDYWRFHLAQEHDRAHASRYANGTVPDPLPRQRPRLTLVK